MWAHHCCRVVAPMGLARPARSALRISITTSSAMPLPMYDHDRPHPHVGMLDQQVAQFAGQHQ